ncbi:MAG: transferase hexapeptide repeat [Gammaproteobacteria bacterium]|nr:transferase hexapeptide repeat [Gammaproteobacteria bacterium]
MIYSLGDKTMQTAAEEYYVAPGACVIGNVRLGVGASVWFNCVIRGDNDWIVIGDGTNVQDGTIIHTDEGEPVHLGTNVSIGHRALLHGCTVGDSTLIANGAMILDHVSIGRHCLIAAGAVVPPGKVIPDGSVVMGMPGKIVREVSDRDRAMMAGIAAHYVERGRFYRQELALDPRSVQSPTPRSDADR